jgi:hypothetical protein
MNSRNRIILFIILAIDVCIFSFGLYQKNISEDYAYTLEKFTLIESSVNERQYTLITEVNAAQDSLNKCCNR